VGRDDFTFDRLKSKVYKMVLLILPKGKVFEGVGEAVGAVCAERALAWNRLEAKLGGKSDSQIHFADQIIIDLSARNADVCYAFGVARALGKRIICLAQHAEDLPAGREGEDQIVYAGNFDFLRRELIACFGQPAQREKAQSEPSKSSAKDRFVSTFGDILSQHQYDHRGRIEMENETTFVLIEQEMDLALVQDLARRAKSLGLRLKLL
jgi:hypothetical protein